MLPHVRVLLDLMLGAHHVFLGRNVLDRPLSELWPLVNVMPDAIAIHSTIVFQRHFSEHAAYIALKSPAQCLSCQSLIPFRLTAGSSALGVQICRTDRYAALRKSTMRSLTTPVHKRLCPLVVTACLPLQQPSFVKVFTLQEQCHVRIPESAAVSMPGLPAAVRPSDKGVDVGSAALAAHYAAVVQANHWDILRIRQWMYHSSHRQLIALSHRLHKAQTLQVPCVCQPCVPSLYMKRAGVAKELVHLALMAIGHRSVLQVRISMPSSRYSFATLQHHKVMHDFGRSLLLSSWHDPLLIAPVLRISTRGMRKE